MLWKNLPFNKVACISDPHGHFNTLKSLISKIPPDYTIVILGDLIDKGKDSKSVVDLVKNNYLALLGNHDHFMTVESNPRFWKRYQSLWMDNNGKDTHKSYGDKWHLQNTQDKKKIFNDHVAYLKTLPLVFFLPNLKVFDKPVLLSHSSIKLALDHFGSIDQLKDFLTNINRQDVLSSYAKETDKTNEAAVQSIMWSRIDSLDQMPDLGVFNVIGHTVQDSGVKIGSHGALIDCGVYKNNKMSALLLPDLTVIEQDSIPDV